MKWLLAVILVLKVAALQPGLMQRAEEFRWSTDADTQGKGDFGGNPSTSAQPKASAAVGAGGNESKRTSQRSDDATNGRLGPDEQLVMQRDVTWLTGALVFVGFLQFFALVGQVVIYCRQAKIMAHQAKEMEGQRVAMRG